MVDLRIAQNPMGRTEQIQAAIDRFAATADDAELGVLASWLYGKTEFLRVLEVLPAPRVANDATLIYRRLDALAALDRWNEIQKAIQSQKGVIDPMLEQMYLARCATQLNEPQVRDARWEAALDTAGTKPEKLLQLGDYAQKTGNLSMAIRAFEAAVQATPEAREPYESLLRALEASGNTRKLRETLTTVLKHWPQDAAVRNDAAYFDALLGENLRSSLDAARGLVRADPTSLPHRVTLALAELRGGNSLAALDAFTAIDTSHIVMQPRQRAVLAAVYWATSYTHEAREAVRTLPLDQLLPEERSLVQPIIDATNAGKSTVGN